jgi:hypothetical protein
VFDLVTDYGDSALIGSVELEHAAAPLRGLPELSAERQGDGGFYEDERESGVRIPQK